MIKVFIEEMLIDCFDIDVDLQDMVDWIEQVCKEFFLVENVFDEINDVFYYIIFFFLELKMIFIEFYFQVVGIIVQVRLVVWFLLYLCDC